MATLASNRPTLLDWAKTRDPDGKTARVAEILTQANPLLLDLQFVEGNLPTGHRTTIRTGLPTVYWRQINAGVPSSKSRTAQVDEGCAMLEARSEIDKKLASLEADMDAYRAQEAIPFQQAMAQEMASTFWYGNAGTAPEEFSGLATRYSSLSAANGQNIINAAGAGADNTSIWLIVNGPNTIHGIFPKGSKAGLYQEDLGEMDLFDASGNRFRGYSELFKWDTGLVVRDWRFGVRICNIDVSNLVAESSAANLVKLLVKAIHRLPDGALNMGRPAIYMNRTVAQMLDIQQLNIMAGFGSGTTTNGGSIKYEDVNGVWQPSFRGITIRITDSILETESVVS